MSPLSNGNIEEIKKIVARCYSVSSVLSELGISPSGGNYKLFDRIKQVHGINTTHFTGRGHLRNKTHTWASKTPDAELFIENYTGGVSSHMMKIRLIKRGIFEHKCYKCNNTEWNNLPIPIELDHINGKHSDNRLENLTILCPNCHSQTPTHCSKNKNKRMWKTHSVKAISAPKIPNTAKIKTYKNITCKCGNRKYHTSTICSDCWNSGRKSSRPTYEQLKQDFEECKSFLQVGNKYNVSDNAVRKWVKLYKMSLD